VVAEAAADDRPRDAPSLRVDRDDQLAGDEPVGEGDDARAGLEPAVDNEPADEPRVQRTDVGERVPDVGDRPSDDDLAMHRSHLHHLRNARARRLARRARRSRPLPDTCHPRGSSTPRP
jgi:hypothetical protein